MRAFLPRNRRNQILLLFHLLLFSAASFGQENCTGGTSTNDTYTNMRQRKITHTMLAAMGSPLIADSYMQGLLEYVPAGYDPDDASTVYPVIIYFPGFAARGDGSSAQLCRILYDSRNISGTPGSTNPPDDGYSLPGVIEKVGVEALTVTDPGGTEQQYIVISAQFDRYNYDNPPGTFDYPSADQVEVVIDHVLEFYNVDTRRIYLTGISTGANMVIEYLASSTERANRIAAASLGSLCSQVDSETAIENGAQNIADSDVKIWFMNCTDDGVAGGDCQPVTATNWINAIVAAGGDPANYKQTILSNHPGGANPPDIDLVCSQNREHNTWQRLYNPAWDGDGTELSFYDWNIQFESNFVLPVKLKSYSARLSNGKVIIEWVTSSEENNASFIIERAGADQRFVAIGTVEGSGTTDLEKQYQFTDANPLSELNFYRLVQVDIDGKKTYFEIKRVLNQSRSGKLLVVTPNPFGPKLSAFVTLDKQQKVTAYLTDMGGRRLLSKSGVYGEGVNEIALETSSLPNGIYMLRIETAGFSEIQRVVKR